MVTRSDYNALAVEAAHSVLLELAHLLGQYREHIVLVGGWVPEFLCPEHQEPHVGSLDVDLALDHRHLTEARYRTLRQLLLERGYWQGNQPYIFFRTVTAGSGEIQVEVDLLGGEYEGTGRTRRTQRVQDLRLRKARGADLAFRDPVEIPLEGKLPDGGKDSVVVRVASIACFLTMKGMALADRLKEKDAWDIYYCLRNYPGGLDRVVRECRLHLSSRLFREGLEKISRHFASVESVGSTHVANFEEVTESEERDRVRRDAWERVNYLLSQLGIRTTGNA